MWVVLWENDFPLLWFKGEEWFCPHESKLPDEIFFCTGMKTCEFRSGVGGQVQSDTGTFFDSPNTRDDYQLQDAGFLLYAFSISRRAFLVDTTISCSALVQKSWIPQAVDNKKEDAIQDVIMLFGDSNSREARCLMMSSRQLMQRNSTELECCIACIFDQPM